ncbi:MAG: DUF488 domain-containing protein [Desulfovibrionaceae bacterium]|nr:DUF488 domain-containing protein [Desulfovibrionaceae bacterium]
MQEQRIYTIGHGIREYSEFFSILSKYAITILIDVRAVPYSSYASHYNKEVLEEVSRKYNVSYLYMGDTLGSPALHNAQDAHILYEKRAQETYFIHAIDRIIKGIKKGYSIVMMCAEYEAYSCHRHLLLATALEEKGITVYHIMKDTRLVPAHSYSSTQYSLI